MRKSIFATFTAAVAVAAALLLTGCERAIDMTGKPVSFAAGISNGASGPKTRVAYGAETSGAQAIDWLEGDRITIYCAQCENKQSAVYKVQDITEATTGNMVSYAGLANAESDGAGLRWGTGDHTFYAVYPGTGTDGATVTIQGKDIMGSIPATQGFTGEITGTDAKVVAPDMRNMYMTAKAGPYEPESDDVTLDFKPLTTVLEFTITKEDSENTMDISSISLTSEGHALSGSFSADLDDTGNGHYGRPKTGLASGTTKENSNSVTISFGDSPVELKKGQSLTFTFFLNPGNGTVVEDEYVINDLTFSISGEIGKDGETKESFNRKTALKKSDGTGVAFPTHQKTRISGLMLPDAIVWTVNYDQVLVTSWDSGVDGDDLSLSLVDPYNGHEYVDLGLSVLWATCNVGASKPENYGKYFAWGEVEGRTPTTTGADAFKTKAFDWPYTPFNNGSSDYNATYFTSIQNTVCPDGILALEYDAAHVNWGGSWRMPTQAEFKELIDNTTKKKVVDYQSTGINGYTFTNKKDSSKSIFLPCAGYGSVNNLTKLNEEAYYWSASFKATTNSYALFNSGGSYLPNKDWRRMDGLTIRPVIAKE